MTNVLNEEKRYDFIVVGAGAAGSVLAGELSASGAQVLVLESGGPDEASTIANPSVWFYNVGGPLDYHLSVAPSPRLNNRKFNMARGHVLGAAAASMPWYGCGACNGTTTGLDCRFAQQSFDFVVQIFRNPERITVSVRGQKTGHPVIRQMHTIIAVIHEDCNRRVGARVWNRVRATRCVRKAAW